MKKFTILLALVILVAMPIFAEHVTPETARKVASTFLKNNGAKANQLTDLSKAAGFPNLYIFTADEGFVVMSADDCVTPILGYSVTNKFVAEGMPENISSWLQGYNNEIQWTIENDIQSNKCTTTEWKDLKEGKASKDTPTAIVGPLLSTQWNQVSPYNDLCPPGTVTGCVATAMAQVMKFWEHPTMGTDSHSYTWNNQTLSANFGNTTYNWNSMTDTYDSSSTSEEKTAVATLMFHCGVSVEMKYNTTSSAKTSDVMSALQTYFGYASCMQYKSKDGYSDEVWITMLKRELNDGRPIQYRGSDAGGNGGHSFVCDGYDSDNNFHFNWGWSGYCDGYYSVNNMNPNPDASATGAGNGIYTIGQSAIFGIEPISSLPAPLLSASASQDAITLTWNTVEDAISYDLYRDNVKIATSITVNSYVDSNVISGTYYEYYVRAVSGETRSNPSNLVTKLAFYRNYTPSALTAISTRGNAMLTWHKPQNNATLQYATDFSGSRYGMGEGKDTYWMEVFAPSRLGNFVGMYFEKVSAYLELTGNYTLFIYQAEPDTDNEPTKLYEKTFPVSSVGWKDIELESPILLNCDKELWVMMYYPYTAGSSQSFWYPATYGAYNEIQYDNLEDEERYNPRLIGELVDGSIKWYHIGANISWLFRTFISDGTFTYNIYDGETKLNDEAIASTTYIHESPEANTIHSYTVKTNYYGGESEASNTASLALGSNTLASLTLDDNDKMTITENSTLTVNGTLTNTNANNLIIEDGGLLITSSDDVAATVKKTITGHEPNDLSGWKFIASPVSTAINPIDAGLITDTYGDSISEGQSASYDLYYFDESQELPWKNYRKNSFSLENGKGYLYANNESIDLTFAGTLYNGNGVVPLACHDGYLYKGWNLVGNPFTCDASIDRPFFIINGRNLKASTGLIPPCTGVMVQAAAVDTTHNTIDYTHIDGNVTFTKVNPSSATLLPNQLQITVAQQVVSRDGISTLRLAQGSEAIDNAIVSFNKGNLLEKFVFNADLAKLYIPNKGKDFAIVTSEGIGEMPLNFSAIEDGTYTLTVNPEGVEMNYLHLIDNLTGNDVDLLASPDYSFEAKSTDYASRFRLVFASVCEDADSDNENFAFINDGNIIVYKEGVMQIIDITGRIVLSGDTINRVSTSRMTPGVYVLRLITANGVKTQKIIIE